MVVRWPPPPRSDTGDLHGSQKARFRKKRRLCTPYQHRPWLIPPGEDGRYRPRSHVSIAFSDSLHLRGPNLCWRTHKIRAKRDGAHSNSQSNGHRASRMRQPPRWTDEQLNAGLERARMLFRDERTREPLEAYTRAFDGYRVTVSKLLDATSNLSQLSAKAVGVLTDAALLEAFRYLAGPPISKDDLIVLADARLSATRLREDPVMLQRVLGNRPSYSRPASVPVGF